MILDTEIYAPAELTGFAREELDRFHANENLDVFSDLLPNDFVRDIEYEIREGGDFEEGMAMFRAYDAESPIGDLPGFSVNVGRIPPISEKIPLGEYDGIRAHQHGDLDNQIERRAARMARKIARRVAYGRTQSLIEGKFDINENGVIYEIDFGRDPAHTTTPSVAWSTVATSDPVADLVAWDQLIKQKGYVPGEILMDTTALQYALRSTKVINAIIGAAAGVTQVSITQFNTLLLEFGLPNVRVESSTIGNQPVLANGQVFIRPTSDVGIGATLWGETAEARFPDWGLDVAAGEGPGIVAGVYRSQDPVRTWVKTAGIVLPYVGSPNATLSALVG